MGDGGLTTHQTKPGKKAPGKETPDCPESPATPHKEAPQQLPEQPPEEPLAQPPPDQRHLI